MVRSLAPFPQPTSYWNFNQSASPIIDKGGQANLTVGGTGNTFGGNSLTIGSFTGYWATAAGKYGKRPRFTMGICFRPIGTDEFSDIVAMGSGTFYNAEDYTWYVTIGAGGAGLNFGVAPGVGDYGTSINLPVTIDNTKKYHLLFGFDDTAWGNTGFMACRKEGDGTIYQVGSDNMSAYVQDRNFLLTNTAYDAGGTISVEYFNALYWDNQFYPQAKLLEQYRSRYPN